MSSIMNMPTDPKVRALWDCGFRIDKCKSYSDISALIDTWVGDENNTQNIDNFNALTNLKWTRSQIKGWVHQVLCEGACALGLLRSSETEQVILTLPESRVISNASFKVEMGNHGVPSRGNYTKGSDFSSISIDNADGSRDYFITLHEVKSGEKFNGLDAFQKGIILAPNGTRFTMLWPTGSDASLEELRGIAIRTLTTVIQERRVETDYDMASQRASAMITAFGHDAMDKAVGKDRVKALSAWFARCQQTPEMVLGSGLVNFFASNVFADINEIGDDVNSFHEPTTETQRRYRLNLEALRRLMDLKVIRDQEAVPLLKALRNRRVALTTELARKRHLKNMGFPMDMPEIQRTGRKLDIVHAAESVLERAKAHYRALPEDDHERVLLSDAVSQVEEAIEEDVSSFRWKATMAMAWNSLRRFAEMEPRNAELIYDIQLFVDLASRPGAVAMEHELLEENRDYLFDAYRVKGGKQKLQWNMVWNGASFDVNTQTHPQSYGAYTWHDANGESLHEEVDAPWNALALNPSVYKYANSAEVAVDLETGIIGHVRNKGATMSSICEWGPEPKSKGMEIWVHRATNLAPERRWHPIIVIPERKAGDLAPVSKDLHRFLIHASTEDGDFQFDIAALSRRHALASLENARKYVKASQFRYEIVDELGVGVDTPSTQASSFCESGEPATASSLLDEHGNKQSTGYPGCR